MEQTIVIAALAFGAVYLASCSKKKEQASKAFTDIIIVSDRTVEKPVKIDADAILSLYDFNHNPDKKATFRLLSISHVEVTDVVEKYLPSGAMTDSMNTNDVFDFRSKCVQRFYADIRQEVEAFNEQESGGENHQGSEVFRTIHKQLAVFSNGSASDRKLIVFSDLLELSDLFSAYSPHGKYLLLHSPEKVEALFEEALPIRPLKNVVVFLVIPTDDKETEKLSVAMAGVYKSMLEKKGAKVFIQSSEKHFYEW